MNLLQLLDPAARHVFLIHEGLTYSFPIAHVDDAYLLFRSADPLKFTAERGYFLARDSAGIVQFHNPSVESSDAALFARSGEYFHRIGFSVLDFEITNRRHHVRHSLNQELPVTVSSEGKSVAGKMMNISEGGMRLAIEHSIARHTSCHFEFSVDPTLPKFCLDGLVAYSGIEEDETGQRHIIGVSFVANDSEGQDVALYRKRIQQLVEYVRQI